MAVPMPTGRAVTPAEARRASGSAFPGVVFDVFNEHLARRIGDGEVTVDQGEVADEIARRLGITRAQVFERCLLAIEGAYEAAGWHVTYDKPGFSETYPATFTFRPKEGRRG